MINDLREINKKLIKLYKNDDEKLRKQLLIKKILSEENCFFKMDIDTAFNILLDLQITNEEIKNVYKNLMSSGVN